MTVLDAGYFWYYVRFDWDNQTAVSEHFLTNNHCDNYMLFIPIEKLKNGRDSFRKAREALLIHKAKTIEPLGINKGY